MKTNKQISDILQEMVKLNGGIKEQIWNGDEFYEMTITVGLKGLTCLV